MEKPANSSLSDPQSLVIYEAELTDLRGKSAEDDVVLPALTPPLCVCNYRDKF